MKTRLHQIQIELEEVLRKITKARDLCRDHTEEGTYARHELSRALAHIEHSHDAVKTLLDFETFLPPKDRRKELQ